MGIPTEKTTIRKSETKDGKRYFLEATAWGVTMTDIAIEVRDTSDESYEGWKIWTNGWQLYAERWEAKGKGCRRRGMVLLEVAALPWFTYASELESALEEEGVANAVEDILGTLHDLVDECMFYTSLARAHKREG